MGKDWIFSQVKRRPITSSEAASRISGYVTFWIKRGTPKWFFVLNSFSAEKFLVSFVSELISSSVVASIRAQPAKNIHGKEEEQGFVFLKTKKRFFENDSRSWRRVRCCLDVSSRTSLTFFISKGLCYSFVSISFAKIFTIFKQFKGLSRPLEW